MSYRVQYPRSQSIGISIIPYDPHKKEQIVEVIFIEFLNIIVLIHTEERDSLIVKNFNKIT